MTESYKAAVCTELSGPSSIRIEERIAPALESGQVRVRVRAAGLNFPDLLMTKGGYQFRPDPPFVPGLEGTGEVIELAADVPGWSVGDRVFVGNKGGLFAEEIVVDCKQVGKLPNALSFDEGACWQTASSTAWHALVAQGDLQAGQTVLVTGASGGVGMAAVQLAKHLEATVIGTASTQEKRAIVSDIGADHMLDPADDDLASQVKSLTGGKGVDIVYDPVGGDLANTATRAIAVGGRYLIVGFASGDIPSFPANHILIKTYSVIGIRAGETPRRIPELADRQAKALAELAELGVMRPHISHRFSLNDAAKALQVLDRREAIGRVVLSMD